MRSLKSKCWVSSYFSPFWIIRYDFFFASLLFSFSRTNPAYIPMFCATFACLKCFGEKILCKTQSKRFIKNIFSSFNFHVYKIIAVMVVGKLCLYIITSIFIKKQPNTGKASQKLGKLCKLKKNMPGQMNILCFRIYIITFKLMTAE